MLPFANGMALHFPRPLDGGGLGWGDIARGWNSGVRARRTAAFLPEV
jgi:hypothetical protein